MLYLVDDNSKLNLWGFTCRPFILSSDVQRLRAMSLWPLTPCHEPVFFGTTQLLHLQYLYNYSITKTYPRHFLFLLKSFIIHESKQGDSRSSFSNSNTKNHWWSGGQKPREGPLSLLISSTLTPSPYIVNGHPMSTIKNRRLISSRIDTGYNYLLCYWNSTLFQNSDDTTRWISLPQHLVKPLYTSQCISCNMTPRQHSPS